MVMARKKAAKEKEIKDQMLDTIDFRGLTQEEVVGQGGLIKQLTGRILQRALEAEMTEHLGYEKNSNAADNNGNSRNGHTEKTVLLENQILLNPNSAIMFTNRGDAHRRSDNIRAAIADYEAALRIDPNHARARQSLRELRGLGSIRVIVH